MGCGGGARATASTWPIGRAVLPLPPRDSPRDSPGDTERLASGTRWRGDVEGLLRERGHRILSKTNDFEKDGARLVLW